MRLPAYADAALSAGCLIVAQAARSACSLQQRHGGACTTPSPSSARPSPLLACQLVVAAAAVQPKFLHHAPIPHTTQHTQATHTLVRGVQVFVVELSRKPLFPGIYTPVVVQKNERLIKEVTEAKRQG